MKQIHLFKKGFVIFLKGATFSDFFRLDYQTTNPQLSESAFRYFGVFFSIRLKPHQVVKRILSLSRYLRFNLAQPCIFNFDILCPYFSVLLNCFGLSRLLIICSILKFNSIFLPLWIAAGAHFLLHLSDLSPPPGILQQNNDELLPL